MIIEAPSPFKEAGYTQIDIREDLQAVNLTPGTSTQTLMRLDRYYASVSAGKILSQAEHDGSPVPQEPTAEPASNVTTFPTLKSYTRGYKDEDIARVIDKKDIDIVLSDQTKITLVDPTTMFVHNADGSLREYRAPSPLEAELIARVFQREVEMMKFLDVIEAATVILQGK